jgi:hypothetical protein
MKVTMLLADAAQAVGGKLYILGGGWSIIGPQPAPTAIALKIEVPWNEANISHRLHLALFDEDGKPVVIPTPDGDKPYEIHLTFEVGRPPGLRPGTPLDVALAISIAPIALRPESRYVWRCSINEQPEEGGEVSFSTRPLQPPPQK